MFLGRSIEANATKSCRAMFSPFIIWFLRVAAWPMFSANYRKGSDKKRLFILFTGSKKLVQYSSGLWVCSSGVFPLINNKTKSPVVRVLRHFITDSSAHRTVFSEILLFSIKNGSCYCLSSWLWRKGQSSPYSLSLEVLRISDHVKQRNSEHCSTMGRHSNL